MRRLHLTATALTLLAVAVTADTTGALAQAALAKPADQPPQQQGAVKAAEPKKILRPEHKDEDTETRELAHPNPNKPQGEQREGREGRHRGGDREGPQGEQREGREGRHRGGDREGPQGERPQGEQREGREGRHRGGDREGPQGERPQGEQREGREGRHRGGDRGMQLPGDHPSPFVLGGFCAAVGGIIGAAIVTLVRRHRKPAAPATYASVATKEVAVVEV